MKKAGKPLKFIKKHLITIWVIVAAIALCGIFAYAKFADNKNYTKRVISADTGNKTLFTSNYLTGYHYKNPKTVTQNYVDDEISCFFEVNLYNYDKNNPSTFYPTDITYTLAASLYKNSGSNIYSLTDDATTLNSILGISEIKIYKNSKQSEPIITLNKNKVLDNTVTDTLSPAEGEKSARITYYIELPSTIIDKDVYVKLSADPTAAHSDIDIIDAYFYSRTNTVNLSTGWTIDLNDNTSNNSPSAFDGYNFAITGSGEADKVLSWDKTILEPNRMEILELFGVDLTKTGEDKEYTDDGNIRSIPVSLSSETNGGRYDIQFYVVDETARKTINGYTDNESVVHSPMTWTEIKNIVTLN